jgi:hypothetical protein
VAHHSSDQQIVTDSSSAELGCVREQGRCVYPLMNNIHSNSEDTAGLLQQAVFGLVGTVALAALVVAFAVEFAPISRDVQQSAHRLLHV